MSYRNQSVDLHYKLVGWFLYDAGFLAEGASKNVLAIKDTYMMNTVLTVVKRFGTSFKTFVNEILLLF